MLTKAVFILNFQHHHSSLKGVVHFNKKTFADNLLTLISSKTLIHRLVSFKAL